MFRFKLKERGTQTGLRLSSRRRVLRWLRERLRPEPIIILVPLICLIAFHDWLYFHAWLHAPREAKPAVISTAGTIFAGIVALFTYLRNLRQQREHFDRKELADEFTDILDRFADDKNPLMRANAANRLAEMASRRQPGEPDIRNKKSYPFYARASAQLSAALHMETEDSVRDEVGKAIRRISEFGAGDEGELLHVLIQDLADANRSAFRPFMLAYADSCCAHGAVPGDKLPQDLFESLVRLTESPLFAVGGSISSPWSYFLRSLCVFRRKVRIDSARRCAPIPRDGVH